MVDNLGRVMQLNINGVLDEFLAVNEHYALESEEERKLLFCELLLKHIQQMKAEDLLKCLENASLHKKNKTCVVTLVFPVEFNHEHLKGE
ncbi:hypothetical protein X546_15570 [Brevibacillus borstelensis cifa_chp40]|nr:hypothetical protein X546_15570 [Brevibacillus borstelensis cifa_chp40]